MAEKMVAYCDKGVLRVKHVKAESAKNFRRSLVKRGINPETIVVSNREQDSHKRQQKHCRRPQLVA